ncbi:MAG: hypothetical protein MR400_10660 [Clostridiales bacterium]|nr:hypothetical protein [Clostridiales bacterium]
MIIPELWEYTQFVLRFRSFVPIISYVLKGRFVFQRMQQKAAFGCFRMPLQVVEKAGIKPAGCNEKQPVLPAYSYLPSKHDNLRNAFSSRSGGGKTALSRTFRWKTE